MLDDGITKDVPFKPSLKTGDKKIYFNDTFLQQSKAVEMKEK